MPEELRALAVSQPHPYSAFGLYLPIKKWCGFTLFEKWNFEEQLRGVVQGHLSRMHISAENFLVRIPKLFYWKNAVEA